MERQDVKIRLDCRYFPGDRPCAFHKSEGASCQTCRHYAKRGISILIIKFDALGDVLRTTSILPSLKRQHGQTFVTWITAPDAAPLLIGNPYVDEVVSDSAIYLAMIHTRHFDIAINPDASPRSCDLASLVNAETKYGFVSSPKGTIVPIGDAALYWLELGANDTLKRANRKTYQQIIHEICELDPTGQHIVVRLTEAEVQERDRLREDLGLDPSVLTIGINTGAGARWPLKKWRIGGFIDLIGMVGDEIPCQILLLGGPSDHETNQIVKARSHGKIRYRQASSLRQFLELIDLCDVVVTGDTLAAHAAVGLGKRVVVLFGPTSPHEVDLYGVGEKIIAPIDCICCYKQRCDRSPNCMDLITPEMVLAALKRQIEALKEDFKRDEILVGEPGR